MVDEDRGKHRKQNAAPMLTVPSDSRWRAIICNGTHSVNAHRDGRHVGLSGNGCKQLSRKAAERL
jgi:hypothetical protein